MIFCAIAAQYLQSAAMVHTISGGTVCLRARTAGQQSNEGQGPAPQVLHCWDPGPPSHSAAGRLNLCAECPGEGSTSEVNSAVKSQESQTAVLRLRLTGRLPGRSAVMNNNLHALRLTRSLMRDGQISPHKPRLVVSHSTCPPISPSPHAISIVIGPSVINNNLHAPFPSLLATLCSHNIPFPRVQ